MPDTDDKSREEKIYRDGLVKTRESLWGRLKSVFASGKRALEAEDLERIEEILITADVGMPCTTRLLEMLRQAAIPENEDLKEDALIDLLSKQIVQAIPETSRNSYRALEEPRRGEGPRVILVAGVNGTGKTTTIGKIAARIRKTGQDVLVVAADTYRAAAIDQLGIWAERSGSMFSGGEEGADPAAIVHDALTSARKTGVDTVIIDTAGRLHTKVPLMKELEKINRVAGKVIEGAPHDVLLVLDATTGQNAMVQAREFIKSAGVTGIVMTKMDGTAKGGILIPLSGELNLPILYVGLGEGLDDLLPFDPEEYAKGLVG